MPDFPCVVENVSVINSKSFRDKVPRLKMELIRPQLKAINTAPLLHDLDLSAIAPI